MLQLFPLFPELLSNYSCGRPSCWSRQPTPSWRFLSVKTIGRRSRVYLSAVPKAANNLTSNRILVCHPAGGGHGHCVREDIFVFFIVVPSPTLSSPSSVPSLSVHLSAASSQSSTKHPRRRVNPIDASDLVRLCMPNLRCASSAVE